MLRIPVVVFALIGIISCSGSSDTSSSTPPSVQSYYIDSVSGADGQEGTSESTAWQSFANIANTSFPENSAVYLKRGSTWYEQLNVPSSNLAFNTYGSGNDPVIDGSVSVTGWADEGGDVYSHTVSLSSGEGLGNVIKDGTLMSFAEWNTDAATSLSGAADNSFTYNYSTSTLYIKTATNPANSVYRASTKLYGINVNGVDNVSIHNVKIQRFSLVGVHFKNCAGCEITDSEVLEGGGAVIGAHPTLPGQYLYAGNGIEFGNSASDGAVNNVTIYQIFDSGLSPQTYSSNQVSGPFTFRNVDISYCGFAGVEISVLANNGSTGSSIDDVTLQDVNVSYSGSGWSGQRYGSEGYGIRIKADNTAGYLQNISIGESELNNNVNTGIHVAGNSYNVNLSRMNIHHNSGQGIEVIEASSTGLKLDVITSLIHDNAGYGWLYNSPTAAGFISQHNTYYNNGLINLAVFSQVGSAVIQNNLFGSDTAMTHLYVDTTLSNTTLDHNCYNDQTNMFGYNGAVYHDVASFSTATGFDANSNGMGNFNLASPATGDFSISSGSTCEGIGAPVDSIATDYANNVYMNPPSAGAFEVTVP